MKKHRNIFSYFYWMTDGQILFVDVFVNLTGTGIFIYFEIFNPRIINFLFCGLTSLSHIFVSFTCKLFMTMF